MASSTLTLTEGASPVTVELSSTEYQALNELNLVTVFPTVTPGVYDVVAGRKVGAVSIGERQVIVRPKISDLDRLLFLMGYAKNPRLWRDDEVSLSAADELLPGVAEAFARMASRAVELGLLQGYKTVSETLPVLRGRMLAGEQMTRLFGLPVPVAVEYDDFTLDIAENQLLAMATLRALSIPRLSNVGRRLLLRLRHALAEVTAPHRGVALPKWQPSRLNARYQSALRVAEIILSTESFEHRVGDLVVTGYMFDMWKIFEDFVTTALCESLQRFGGHCVAQAPLHLDADATVGMNPDLLWYGPNRATAVIDAKYKAEKPEGFPNADLYQMLAYCTVLRLDEGHLVYAKGNEPVSTHDVCGSDITIHCHALDMGLPPRALLRQVDELAAVIAAQPVERT